MLVVAVGWIMTSAWIVALQLTCQPDVLTDAPTAPTAAAAAPSINFEALNQAPVPTLRYRIKYATEVRNVGQTPARVQQFEVPVLSASSVPYQNIANETFSHNPTEVKVQSDGTRVAYFSLGVIRPGQSVVVERNYEINVWPFGSVSPAFGSRATPAELQRYLLPEPGIESNDPRFQALAQEVVGNASTTEEKVDRIYQYVRSHMRYDLNSPARNKGALAGWQQGSGVCTEFAGLFAALARASGVPTRVVNGRIETWALSSGAQAPQQRQGQTLRHQWAEFYHPQLGWYPIDPTLSDNWRKSLMQPHRFAENHGDRSIKAQFRGGQITLKTTVTVQVEPLE